MNIEYLTWPIIRYKREVLFGWVDLLVSFGGIAGLFLGFSLLSGVEIVYYFTLRAFCMLYKNRVNTSSLSNRLLKYFDQNFLLILLFQDELYAIEEEKLSKPQRHIDLSFNVIKSFAEDSDVHKINVAEAIPKIRYDETTKMNRTANNAEASKVRSKLSIIFRCFK